MIPLSVNSHPEVPFDERDTAAFARGYEYAEKIHTNGGDVWTYDAWTLAERLAGGREQCNAILAGFRAYVDELGAPPITGATLAFNCRSFKEVEDRDAEAREALADMPWYADLIEHRQATPKPRRPEFKIHQDPPTDPGPILHPRFLRDPTYAMSSVELDELESLHRSRFKDRRP